MEDVEEAKAGADEHYRILVNPSAGGGRAEELLPMIRRSLESRGMNYELVTTENLEHAVAEARVARVKGAIPVVMSGDGMIGKVGGELCGTDTPLGILPGGRGNDFARVVGIPTEPSQAVANLQSGVRRRIDVGEANGVRFLCIASCGFDSDANRIANEVKLIKGPLVYAYAALVALARWRPAKFVLRCDGRVTQMRGYSVAVANSKAYGGGMFVAPDADLEDGELDVITTGEVSKLRFLSGLPDVFKGTHIERDEVGFERARQVRIEADRPFEVYADGECITELPATIRVLPRSLTVIAPPLGPEPSWG